MRAKCLNCGRFVKNYTERPQWLAGMGWIAEWTCLKCGECWERI